MSPRSRASARAAGSNQERLVADYLRDKVSQYIDRRVKTGAKDKGDIANLRTRGGRRIVVEVKNTAKLAIGTWIGEAEEERVNDQAVAGIVVHKRHGKAAAGEQLVTMTLRDFAAIITEERPDE